VRSRELQPHFLTATAVSIEKFCQLSDFDGSGHRCHSTRDEKVFSEDPSTGRPRGQKGLPSTVFTLFLKKSPRLPDTSDVCWALRAGGASERVTGKPELILKSW